MIFEKDSSANKKRSSGKCIFTIKGMNLEE
jgi:hypothetical protein